MQSILSFYLSCARTFSIRILMKVRCFFSFTSHECKLHDAILFVRSLRCVCASVCRSVKMFLFECIIKPYRNFTDRDSLCVCVCAHTYISFYYTICFVPHFRYRHRLLCRCVDAGLDYILVFAVFFLSSYNLHSNILSGIRCNNW